ncbi:unnamed protein product [Ambrosiozyma monospora]|uniref:Unnamed protein product n=1 Tax=Ambrosiozyma monospora TaxID=43982 RepID=A0ACB5T209_AMBMO|nr:unnamed protein product [Ambrosiozyma monospora]
MEVLKLLEELRATMFLPLYVSVKVGGPYEDPYNNQFDLLMFVIPWVVIRAVWIIWIIIELMSFVSLGLEQKQQHISKFLKPADSLQTLKS